MKKDIHPSNYRLVIFEDSSSSERFLIESTVATTETGKWEDGKEYPLYYIEVSSASHPFYTGKQNLVDTAGRVDRFKKIMERTAVKAASAKDKKAKKTEASTENLTTKEKLQEIKKDLDAK